jgi:hypothetical protein
VHFSEVDHFQLFLPDKNSFAVVTVASARQPKAAK